MVQSSGVRRLFSRDRACGVCFFQPVGSGERSEELGLWYGEDLMNRTEGDNDGKSCCNVYVGLRGLDWMVCDGFVTLGSKRNLVLVK